MASTTVNITITDVNNKLPVFEDPGKITILENTSVGTFICQLLAHDLDADPMLRYYLDRNVSEARSEEGILIKPSEYDFVNPRPHRLHFTACFPGRYDDTTTAAAAQERHHATAPPPRTNE